MASENETVADIVKEKRDTADEEELKGKNTFAFDLAKMLREEADRIESAHKREIAELRECLRIIRDNLLSHTIKSEDGKYVNNGGFLSEEFVDDERWRKALEGSNNATK